MGNMLPGEPAARICQKPQHRHLHPVLQYWFLMSFTASDQPFLTLEQHIPLATGSKTQPKPWLKFSSVKPSILILQSKVISL